MYFAILATFEVGGVDGGMRAMSWREAKTAFSACPDISDENPVSVHSNESVEAGAEREEAVMA